jgi:signal transduction histidine kinase/ActR/RegA family two-component response regulator
MDVLALKWPASPARSYGLAIALAVAPSVGARLLDVRIAPALTLVLLYPAVTVAGWVGGPGPAWLAAAMSVLVTSVPWEPPFLAVAGDPDYLVGVGLFILNGLLVAGLAGQARRATQAADRRVMATEQELSAHRTAAKRLDELNGQLRLKLAEQDLLLAEASTTRAEADSRAREAQLLSELALTLNDALDLQRMPQPIAAVARAVCGADVARIVLPESPSDRLVVHYQAGGRAEGERLPLDEALAHAVMTTGRPLRVAATLAVPIRIGDRVAGLICVDNLTDREFTVRDERVLGDVAGHAAVAIRNAERLAGAHLARAQAEAANHAKDEFLAILGHELRNPLGAIGNAVRAFHHLGDQATRLQSIITRQTHHLARILDDLLDVARLATGKIALTRQPVDLKDVAERALASLTQQGQTARHEITLTGASAVVDGDPTRLEQVVRNLLDNAVKYTPEGGQIDITVTATAEQARLRITDTGIGIAPELLPRIFDQFVQGVPGAGSPGGFGLGLSLVRRLVEAHGGTVFAASAGTDCGSEFEVRLPLLGEASPRGGDRAPSGSPPPTPRHVLIIEDNADLRDGLRLLLEGMGHRVEEAADGVRGLELLRASGPDIALVDVGLPGLDGFAVARAIRQTPGGCPTVLVAMTGYGRPEDRRRAEEAGFAHYLVKPVDEADLLAVLAGSARSDTPDPAAA